MRKGARRKKSEGVIYLCKQKNFLRSAENQQWVFSQTTYKQTGRSKVGAISKAQKVQLLQ